VPLVIVLHGLAAPGLDRQSWLGPVECLELALFVNRQHHRMGRRIDPRVRLVAGPSAGSEPDNVGQLGDETGVVRALEGAQAVRLRFVTPNRSADPNSASCRWLWAIARPVQWVAWCGGAARVNATTRAVVSAAIGALPGLRGLSRNKPSTRSRRNVVATATLSAD